MPSAAWLSVSSPSMVTFLVMLSLPVVRSLVKLAVAIFSGSTFAFTSFSVVRRMPMLDWPSVTSVMV